MVFPEKVSCSLLELTRFDGEGSGAELALEGFFKGMNPEMSTQVRRFFEFFFAKVAQMKTDIVAQADFYQVLPVNKTSPV